MDSKQIALFMALAGQKLVADFETGTPEKRRLGAQLLLSEVLEFVIKGLGVCPIVNGQKISDANKLDYINESEPNRLEMLDGLADVAYTMYWNALAFGVPLEEGFNLVCANNLDKFIALPQTDWVAGPLEQSEWHLKQGITWPSEVVVVEIVKVSGICYAVGKDAQGKVRKPSTYHSVDLANLIAPVA